MDTTLEQGGKTIENPTDADIDRALEGPRDDDWIVSLYRGEDGDCMEAMTDSGELWVEVSEGDKFVQARSRLDEAIVRSMLLAFRDGRQDWRDLAMWKPPPPPKKQTVKGPLGVALGLGLLVPVLVLTAVITGRVGWIGVLFALAFPGIIAVAAATKIAEAKRAAKWTKASGRVTRAELATETRFEKQVQVPRIEYEYSVGFHRLIGKRVSFAELIAGPQAQGALARYPVGTGVPVYYDPANPSDCVIERDLPPFVSAIWGVVAVMTAAILFGAWWYLLR